MAVQLERQLALVALLSGSRRGLGRDGIFRRLARFYPVQTPRQAVAAGKTLMRDMEALASLGMPVLSGDGEDGAVYRVVPPSEVLPEDFSLSAPEADGLRRLLADPVVRQQLAPPCARILSNLLAFHAPFDRAGLGEDRSGDSVDARLSRLLAMARERSSARIGYPDRTGGVGSRGLSPIGGWLHRGSPYVVGMCHRDGVPKTFSVARITRLEAGDDPFREPPPNFDFEAYASRNAFRLEDEIGLRKVEIRVSAEESWRLKERAPWAVVETYPDGAVRAAFDVSSPRRFYRMVLGYGRFAEILGPPETRQGFSDFLRDFL